MNLRKKRLFYSFLKFSNKINQNDTTRIIQFNQLQPNLEEYLAHRMP